MRRLCPRHACSNRDPRTPRGNAYVAIALPDEPLLLRLLDATSVVNHIDRAVQWSVTCSASFTLSVTGSTVAFAVPSADHTDRLPIERAAALYIFNCQSLSPVSAFQWHEREADEIEIVAELRQ